MDQRFDDLSRRTLITSALGAATGLTMVAVTGSPAEAATGTQLSGVAEVLDTTPEGLLVRLRSSETKLHVRTGYFGDMQVERGDLVAVVPDYFTEDQAAYGTPVAQPYLRVDQDGAMWAFDRTGDARLVGTRS